jgi:hypothetical protein
VTDALVDAARDRALANAQPGVRPAIERRWTAVEVPERFPALGSAAGMPYSTPPEIIASDAGELWVHAYPTEPAESRRWWVFGADGALMGSVHLPPRFELHAVGEAGALGIELDAFDVERVVVYGLDPGA